MGRGERACYAAELPPAQQIDLITRRRAACGVPENERYRPKWMMALEMLDELAGWGHQPPVLTGDAGYGQVAEFRDGLTARDIRYVLATPATTTAYPVEVVPTTLAHRGRGRPSVPRYRQTAPTLKELALQAGRQATQLVRWRTGSRTDPDHPTGQLAGHFLALRVRPAGRHVAREDDGQLPQRWLLVQWPPDADEPSDYWLSDLPADTPCTTWSGTPPRGGGSSSRSGCRRPIFALDPCSSGPRTRSRPT